jgi:PKD repeat protein
MGAAANVQEDLMRPPTARFSRVAFVMIAPLALLAAQAQAQAQSTPPMPSFTFSPASPVPGVPVFFTNTTPGPLTNLAWSFGDPSSGTDNHSFLPDPSHVFANPGTYSVLLTVANASASASVSRSITVAGSGGGPGGGTCIASATQLCLNDSRFAVTSTWTTPDGNTGSGNAVLLTTDSGYFWFFDSTNVELVTKVLNGCGVNDAYWVFASGLTNVAVNLLVVDTQTGVQYTYDNPQSVAFPPDQAIKAFPTSCP